MAIAIGSSVVLTAIIAALVFALWWQKRHKTMRPQWYSGASDGMGSSSGGLALSGAQCLASYRSTESTAVAVASAAGEFCLGRPTDNFIMLLPAARQPTDPLPSVVAALVDPDMTSSQETEVTTTTSEYLQRFNATMTLPMVKTRPSANGGVGSPGVRGDNAPRFMTLQRCDSSSGTVPMATPVRDDSGLVVMPPPAIPMVVLQPTGGRVGQSVGGGKARPVGVKPPAGGQQQQQPSSAKGVPVLFIDEILDGYHSGDNVDDDIDNVDYTIKMPSFRHQIN